MRYIGELISLLFFFLMLRSVIGGVWRMLAGPGSSAPSESRERAEPSRMQTSGELHKDPVCGTFVAASTAYTKAVAGGTAYFCSKECRDRYKPAASSSEKWRHDTPVRS